MAIFVISDLHLWHLKLERDGKRPVGFTETIQANCQKLIKPDDTVICTGDVSFGKDRDLAPWMASVPGKWTLTRGNHDHRASFYLSRGFAFACESFILKYNGLLLLFSHEPTTPLPDDMDYCVHGHFHGTTDTQRSHRAEEWENNTFFQANKDRYHLIEIESCLGPRKLDDILKYKKPLAPYRREIENPQGPPVDG